MQWCKDGASKSYDTAENSSDVTPVVPAQHLSTYLLPGFDIEVLLLIYNDCVMIDYIRCCPFLLFCLRILYF